MAYQALYRVWRPQKFSDMVGQEIITKTLKNAIITGQTSHAYLFTGPRGTGKTSAAKIFAKALNCLNLIDGEPCNECENCQAINNGSLNDVIEIDAASNNGVEEIRDIRDKAKYAPTQAPFKVYIIDEVHMLSTGAFNALLKTLEEPPAQVVFILATTEPHKIPLTIISRTQRFDFKRIGTMASIARMEYILQQKQYKYEDAALKVIANAAEGGMRDALSILDQTLSFGEDEVTLDNALLVTGAVKQSLLNEYVAAFIDHDVQQSLQALQSILQEGKDAHRLIEDLISYIRDLLLANQAPEMVNVTPNEQFENLSKRVTPDYAYAVINVLNDVQQQLRFTTHPDVYLEVLTVKLANLTTINSNNEQLAVTQPIPTARPAVHKNPLTQEKQVPKQIVVEKAISVKPANIDKEITAQPVEKTVIPVGAAATIKNPATPGSIAFDGQAVFNVLTTATKGALKNSEDLYPDLMHMLSVIETAKMNQARPVAASPNGIVLAFDKPYIHHMVQQDTSLQTHLVTAINRLTGSVMKLVLVTQDQWNQLRESYINQYKAKVEFKDMQIPQLSALEIESKPPVVEPKATTNDELTSLQATMPNDVVDDSDLAIEMEPEVVSQAKELFGEIVTVQND